MIEYPNIDSWEENASEYIKHGKLDNPTYVYENLVNSPAVLNICPRKAEKVIDLGCGSGDFTSLLSEKYPLVYGADGSKRMLKKARENLPDTVFYKFNLEKEFPKFVFKFDLVVLKLVLMFVNDMDRVAQECSKIINFNGFLVVSVPHPIRWFACYLENKNGIRFREGFDLLDEGYFTELPIPKSIGGIPNVRFNFIHRTLGTYLNTFASCDLFVDKIEEPRLTKDFLEKFPDHIRMNDVPLRLNMRLVKK